MKDIDFIDASAFLRVQEKRLLSSGSIERIVDAPNLQEVFRMLSQNTDYDFTQLRRSDEYENMLKEELRRVYKLARSLTPYTQVVDVLGAKYDFHNMKTALKAKYFPQRTASPWIHATELDVELLTRFTSDMGAKSDLPAYVQEAMRAAEEAFNRTKNPQYIDMELDRAMFARMLDLCGEIENEFITEYVQMLIDFYNVKALLRIKAMQKGSTFLDESLVEGGKTPVSFYAKNYGKPTNAMPQVFLYKYFGDAVSAGIELYEKKGSLAGLERLLDDQAVEFTKSVKLLAFGAEILFVYILSKENEIRQIRILVTCKQNQIPSEEIRERLRDNYA